MSQKDTEVLKKLRKRIFLAAYRGGMAHIASSFSALEIIYTLYLKGIMKYDAKNPDMPDRDRFVLSKGHGGLALYSVLCEAGFLDEEMFFSYLKPWTNIGGEPNLRDLKGIEASTGSLGHGIAMAEGMAIAQKIDNKESKTYVLIGDGESEEGSVWEVAMNARAHKLDNFVVILDCNGLQKTGAVQETLDHINWREKWSAFGWNVLETDGHDVDMIKETIESVPSNGRPTMIIAHTIKGKGVSIMENNFKWHFKVPKKKELEVFMSELDISSEELEEV